MPEREIHTIPPFYKEDSRILILGSFPSVKSREQKFFYGHPQNRFWSVLAAVLEREIPQSIPDKKALLEASRAAVWDVIASCEITGSSDSSIRNAVPNDISVILNNCPIENIYVNGRTAEKLYNKYILQAVKRPAVCLPSTSPANAAWTLPKLIEAWSVIR